MYLLILTLPLLSFAINAMVGRKVGNLGGPLLAIGLLCSTALLVAVGYYEVVLHKSPVAVVGLGP